MSEKKVLTKEEIEKCFGYPIHEACLMLKVETKELQKLCREYDIKRWPKIRKKAEKGGVFQEFTIDRPDEKPKPKNKKENTILPKMHSIEKFGQGSKNEYMKLPIARNTYKINSTKNFDETKTSVAVAESHQIRKNEKNFELKKDQNHLHMEQVDKEITQHSTLEETENKNTKKQKTMRDVMSMENILN